MPTDNMTIRIVTDSTSDLPAGMAKQYGIEVVPCFINFGDESYRDGVDISRGQFYQRLGETAALPKTSAPGAGAFQKAYEKLACGGAKHILSMHIHSGLSNLADAARLAAQAVKSTKVTVIEMGQVAAGLGFQVVNAARLALMGVDPETILSNIREWETRTFVFAALDTVDYLRASGRVPALAAKLADLLRIKPIIQLHQGKIRLVGRVRTSAQAVARLLECAADLQPLEQVAVLHTHAWERAKSLQAALKERIAHGMNVSVSEATPVLGVHVGPGGVGLACLRGQ